MEKEFWLERWTNGETAFHEKSGNQFLVKHFSQLNLPTPANILVPLCGKSVDMAWLAAQGHHVVGVELAETAVKDFFSAFGVTPKITNAGHFKRYQATQIEIFCGDFFETTRELLGKIDAVYDRAAIVALPQEMRKNYTQHLLAITDKAPQLAITYDYDQSKLPGPPFSVSQKEMQSHYGDTFDVQLLDTLEVGGGLKGKCPATENVWLLS